MKKCPNCKHKLYKKEGGGFYCKNCNFVNDPNYKAYKKVDDYKDYEMGKPRDKKQKKLGEFE